MFLFLVFGLAAARRHRGRRHSATNQETELELLSADAGGLRGVRLGPRPRFRRYRTARFLEQLLRKVKYEKNLAEEVEKRGATGMEKLMREMLRPIEPYARRAVEKQKKWAPLDKQYMEKVEGLWDDYVDSALFKSGVPFKKAEGTNYNV